MSKPESVDHSGASDCSPAALAGPLVYYPDAAQTEVAALWAEDRSRLIEQIRRCHDWIAGEWLHAAEDVQGVSRESMVAETHATIRGVEWIAPSCGQANGQ